MLEATLRLGGYQPIARRSVDEALNLRASDERPIAVVLDLGADSGEVEVDTIRVLLAQRHVLPDHPWKIIVILPERLANVRDTLGDEGVEVLVRPYPPSQLFAAIGAVADPQANPDPSADPPRLR